MNTNQEPRVPRRVMINLGPVCDSDTAVEAAANLAAAMQAELHGLFVEEEALVDLANLPFAQAFSPRTGRASELDPETMHDAFERRAHACRRALSARAQSAQLTWSFDITRGDALHAVTERATRDDLIVLQQSALGHTSGDLLKLARSVAGQTDCVCVIAESSRRARGPIVAIDDGDEAGISTVTLAGRLARSTGLPVRVFVIAADEARGEQTAQRALTILDGVESVAVDRFATGDCGLLASALRDATPRFVVADMQGEPFGGDTDACRLIRAAAAPVILLRGEPPA